MAVHPIGLRNGEDLSPLNQPSNAGKSGIGFEEMDVEHENKDDPCNKRDNAKASSSSDQQPNPIYEEVGSAPVISVRDPGSATQAELDEHEKTHLPYRSWCPVCVMAKGKADSHFPSKSAEKGRHTISKVSDKN